jgi:hypothetical protein
MSNFRKPGYTPTNFKEPFGQLEQNRFGWCLHLYGLMQMWAKMLNRLLVGVFILVAFHWLKAKAGEALRLEKVTARTVRVFIYAILLTLFLWSGRAALTQPPPTTDQFLAKHGVENTIPGLRAALKNPDWEMRSIAAQLLVAGCPRSLAIGDRGWITGKNTSFGISPRKRPSVEE